MSSIQSIGAPPQSLSASLQRRKGTELSASHILEGSSENRQTPIDVTKSAEKVCNLKY